MSNHQLAGDDSGEHVDDCPGCESDMVAAAGELGARMRAGYDQQVSRVKATVPGECAGWLPVCSDHIETPNPRCQDCGGYKITGTGWRWCPVCHHEFPHHFEECPAPAGMKNPLPTGKENDHA